MTDKKILEMIRRHSIELESAVYKKLSNNEFKKTISLEGKKYDLTKFLKCSAALICRQCSLYEIDKSIILNDGSAEYRKAAKVVNKQYYKRLMALQNLDKSYVSWSMTVMDETTTFSYKAALADIGDTRLLSSAAFPAAFSFGHLDDYLTVSFQVKALWIYILIANGLGGKLAKFISELSRNNLRCPDMVKIVNSVNEDCTFEEYCDILLERNNGIGLLKEYVKHCINVTNYIESYKNYIVACNEQFKLQTELKLSKKDRAYNKIMRHMKEVDSHKSTQGLLAKGVDIRYAILQTYSDKNSGDYDVGCVIRTFMWIAFDETNNSDAFDDILGAYKSETEKLYRFMEYAGEMAEKVASSTDRLIINLADARYRLETAENKLQEHKKISKESGKDVERLTKEIKSRDIKIERLEESLEELRSRGIESSKPYTDEISRLKGRNDLLTADRDFMRGSINKLEQSRDTLTSELNGLREELASKDKDIEKLREQLNRSILTAQSNGLPMDCYINALKDKRVAIFGGDVMHEQINKLGLSGVALFKVDYKGAVSEDAFRNYDLLVVCTSQISHSMSAKVDKLSEKWGVPLYRFNNRNVNKLLIELFAEIYR